MKHTVSRKSTPLPAYTWPSVLQDLGCSLTLSPELAVHLIEDHVWVELLKGCDGSVIK